MKRISLLMLTTFLFLVSCSSFESNMSREVADFQFINQNHEEVGLDDLKGKWWVADFIFTNCVTICLPMTSNMVKLQEKLAENDLDVYLISFSVDPDHDTPEVLKEYAQNYEADLSNWSFLTGYDFETIQDISMNSFISGLQKEPDSDQVQHSSRFFLVNPEGEIIKYYSGIETDTIDEIIKDLKILIKS